MKKYFSLYFALFILAIGSWFIYVGLYGSNATLLFVGVVFWILNIGQLIKFARYSKSKSNNKEGVNDIKEPL